ncbi:MAG: hypothetical protein FWD61_10360 [Phycisphaerales bacterium]|nr:hypothetical protein [Phycisphaerales bacterium]
MRPVDKLRLDRTNIRFFSSFEEMEQDDIERDMSQTPLERWQEMEIIRQLNHVEYDPITSRIPRPCKIIQRPGIKVPADRRVGRRALRI